ncbi:MAG: YebC/PmpR family DNA-binding transcriptional regulator [Candidatus Gracilibacteria bacterium]
MARHSHFANMKRWKAVVDAERGKVFTVHARMIAVAAKNGGDPVMNPMLRTAIDRAKAANVPNSNIERAIKKGTGEDKEGSVFEEITYEAMGPGGSGFLIDVITDNKNRALLNIRKILGKNDGTLGSSGSVMWKFAKKAVLLVDPKGKIGDETELTLIDAGAEDFVLADGKYEVYGGPDQLNEMKKKIVEAGFHVERDELVWQPKDELILSDLETAQKVIKLNEALEMDEDVVRVTSNVDFDEALLSQLG